MISPISFGSTYKVQTRGKELESAEMKHFAMEDFCALNKIPCKTKDNNNIYDFIVTTTMVAPDSQDDMLELYLQNNGINFKKFTTDELLTQRAIENRIKPAPKGMILAKVRPDKLMSIAQQQNGNIEYCSNVYNKYAKENMDFAIKSGDAITPASLSINSCTGRNDETIKYVKKFGVENLNPKSIFIDFNQKTNDFDHCMFFAMLDAGMKEVPVYVPQEQYKLGKALEILK